MIQHTVLIRWKTDAAPEATAEALHATRAYLDIDGVLDVQTFRNLGFARPEYGRGVANLLVIMFRDENAAKAFTPHPVHRQVGAAILALADELTIVDHVVEKAATPAR